MIKTYIDWFSRNLFQCLKSCSKYREGTFNANNDVPNRVYHGTSNKFLPSILKKGLLPFKYGQCWKEDIEQKTAMICLTDSMYAAEFFAIYASDKVGGEPIVLEISIKGIKDEMRVNLEELSNGQSTPFDIYKELCFEDPISPKLISDWYYVPKHSAFKEMHHLKPMINQIRGRN